jgi:quercetin dioxygenase-like cupin family protein
VSSTPPPRRDRPATAPLAHLRLPDEIERLKTEQSWIEGDRNAITLAKGAGLTLVLTALRRGAVLREHRAPGHATLHLLAGRMVLRADERSLDLAPGDVVTLEAGLPHAAEAVDDAVFLLTIVERI